MGLQIAILAKYLHKYMEILPMNNKTKDWALVQNAALVVLRLV